MQASDSSGSESGTPCSGESRGLRGDGPSSCPTNARQPRDIRPADQGEAGERCGGVLYFLVLIVYSARVGAVPGVRVARPFLLPSFGACTLRHMCWFCFCILHCVCLLVSSYFAGHQFCYQFSFILLLIIDTRYTLRRS